MQNQTFELSQPFRDQTVALFNLPPLAEFEKFLRSRFRGTGVGASTFLQALVPPDFGSPKAECDHLEAPERLGIIGASCRLRSNS